MTIKLEELTQQELDRLLKIERVAKTAYEDCCTIQYVDLISDIGEALKPAQKPKYRHDDRVEFVTRTDQRNSLALYRRTIDHKDNVHMQLTKLLLDYKDTYCPNYVWVDGAINSYIFVNPNGEFDIDYHLSVYVPSVVYMETDICRQLIDDINGGVVDVELDNIIKRE